MFTKKVLVSALIAAGTIFTAAAPLPSIAASNFEVYVNTAPPPPRYEAVPAPRRGYVWAPGHWQWNNDRHRHFWVAGHWERARPGYAFHEPTWVERNGRWHYQPSRWDRDGDGIPNNRDRTPDGRSSGDRDRDGIPNNRDRDRDGDGVPNNRDNYPNDPRYR